MAGRRAKVINGWHIFAISLCAWKTGLVLYEGAVTLNWACLTIRRHSISPPNIIVHNLSEDRDPSLHALHACCARFLLLSSGDEWRNVKWFWNHFNPSTPKSDQISNFPCNLSRNITSHSMKNLAFHSLLKLKDDYCTSLITSLVHFSL